MLFYFLIVIYCQPGNCMIIDTLGLGFLIHVCFLVVAMKVNSIPLAQGLAPLFLWLTSVIHADSDLSMAVNTVYYFHLLDNCSKIHIFTAELDIHQHPT
ncbi:hypothetical protein BDC45DRAFT_119139 [Circinella umbellata]|nr:hypothetical protein BDC45DRAFT_119139 [Circinella umbellata]